MSGHFENIINERFYYDGEEVYWRVNKGSRKAGDLAGAITQGRVMLSIDGAPFPAESVAFFLHYGRFPDGVLQHVNGDKLDNRIENIREPLEAS